MIWKVYPILRQAVLILGCILLILLTACGGAVNSNPSNLRESSNFFPIKIAIREEGIYEISLSSLKEISPWLDDLSQLQLFCQGHFQRIWLSDDLPGENSHRETNDEKLYFYGRPSKNKYALDNIYWLIPKGMEIEFFPPDMFQVWADNQENYDSAYLVRDIIESGSHDSFQSTIKFETNRIYSPVIKQKEHWFWWSLTAPQDQSFEFSIEELIEGEAYFRVMVWSSTEAPVSPDHHLLLELNNQIIDDRTWDGNGPQLIEVKIPPGLLLNDSNKVSLILPGDTQSPADIILIDWIEITYQRSLLAKNNRLAFVAQSENIHLQGFQDSFHVYDVTTPDKVDLIASVIKATDYFQVIPGHRYLAISSEGYWKPKQLEIGRFDTSLLRPGNEVDYLAVGPQNLLKSLQPLLDMRTEQGYQVMALPWEAVVDQFGWGLPDPQAIRNLLAYTNRSWKSSPKYLLLVGDASYDPRNYTGQKDANQLPTFLVNTSIGGETGSDLGFSEPTFEHWGEKIDLDVRSGPIAIGRIPARDSSQVMTFVQKIINYEKARKLVKLNQDWKQRVLLISDGQDPAFENQALILRELFSDKYETDLMVTKVGEQDINQEIIERFHKGNLFTIYFGHGSPTMWGKDRLFTSKDAVDLKNQDRLTIVWNFTCLTGLFTHPEIESLAETMLWNERGGAVAVLAPTSLTLSSDQISFGTRMVQVMLEEPGATIGEILLRARQYTPIESAGQRDVIMTFLLFGDPAMHFDDLGN